MSPSNLCIFAWILISWQVGNHKSRNSEQQHAYGQYECYCSVFWVPYSLTINKASRTNVQGRLKELCHEIQLN